MSNNKKFEEVLVEAQDGTRILVRIFKDEDFTGEAIIQVRRYESGWYINCKLSSSKLAFELARQFAAG